ncbi:MAG: hypothetical protein AMJ84_03870 [Acidithiobacillales bacterium SM23_46]|nr:MAG: hypothetical protein AMJ84_03870 [Acidithiobacillales bacterium SM23_46]
MAATITWIVQQMDCYPTTDGETDVVFTVHWRCNGVDGEYAGTAYGTQSVTYEAGAPFTPYADLTQDQVIGWVKDDMGPEQVASIEANVEKQVQDAMNPPVIAPPLPW